MTHPLGGHAHPRSLLDEPEASAPLHQEDAEDRGRGQGVPGRGEGDESQRGLLLDEPDGLRANGGHVGRPRRQEHLPQVHTP